jgi:hypothetical protein
MKEDGIIYQGTIQAGQPIENGFDYYPGQEDDLVVKLDFEDGKHVAPFDIQQKPRIEVAQAGGRTTLSRNIETVSPNEIVAVSPEQEFDWYRVADSWNPETETIKIDPDEL